MKLLALCSLLLGSYSIVTRGRQDAGAGAGVSIDYLDGGSSWFFLSGPDTLCEVSGDCNECSCCYSGFAVDGGFRPVGVPSCQCEAILCAPIPAFIAVPNGDGGATR